MEDFLTMLQDFQQQNQRGNRFNMNLSPIADIGHFRVNPTRGYLAQDGGPILPVADRLSFLPGLKLLNQFPFQLQSGGTIDSINRVPSNGPMGIPGTYSVPSPLNLSLSLMLPSADTFGNSLIPNRQFGGFQAQTVKNSNNFGFEPRPTNIALSESARRVLEFHKKDLDQFGDEVFDYIDSEGLEGDQKAVVDRYNLQLKLSGLLGKPKASSLKSLMTMEQQGILEQNQHLLEQQVPKLGFGDFLRNVGNTIWDGVRGAADFQLSMLGADNVIQDTFVDRSGLLSGAANVTGGLMRTAANMAIPGLGTATGAVAGMLNPGGPAGGMFGSMGMPGLGSFSSINLPGMATPYQSTFGQGIFGRQPLSFQSGGLVSQIPEGFIPIQTEVYKGVPEVLLHLDGTITPVNATTSHDKMDKDFITDIVPEKTYVASARPDMAISKNVLSDWIVDLKIKPYEEGKKMLPPEEVTADILLKKGEKKILPAVFAQRVRKKFNTVDKEDQTDIFTERTNKENISNRLPYLQVLVAEGEKNRAKKEEKRIRREFAKGGKAQRLGYSDGSPYRSLPSLVIDNNIIDMSNTGIPLYAQSNTGEVKLLPPYSGEHTFEGADSVLEIPIMKYGGKVKKKKYQAGGFSGGDIAGLAATALPAIMGLFSANQRPGGPTGTLDPLTNTLLMGSFPLQTLGTINNINAQESALTNALGNLENLNSDLMGLNNMGTTAGIASLLAQQTDLPEINFDFSRLQNFNTQTPQSFIRAAETPVVSTNAILDRLGSRGAASFIANDAANRISARNNVAMNQFNADRNLDFNIANTITRGMNTQEQLNNQIQQQEIAARNNIFSEIGSQVQSNLSNRGNILSDTFTQGTNLDLQLARLSGQIPMTIGQNMLNMGALRQQLLAQQFAATQPGSFANNPTQLSQEFLDLGQAMGNLGSSLSDPSLGQLNAGAGFGFPNQGAYDMDRLGAILFDNALYPTSAGYSNPNTTFGTTPPFVANPNFGNTGFTGSYFPNYNSPLYRDLSFSNLGFQGFGPPG